MNLTELIHHPERMDRETLYDLRSLIALHPYFQTARILMLRNLYLLHDPTFDEELRRAAIYITDRRVLFQMIEAAHYKLRNNAADKKNNSSEENSIQANKENTSRTTELIDNFLGSIPEDTEESKGNSKKRISATPGSDYIGYLIENGLDDFGTSDQDGPQLKGQSLIDDFISSKGSGRIILPELDNDPNERSEHTEPVPEEFCTETMAQIYVRQGRYSQALEIIKRLNLDNPKKNTYFADQIRFLEKLIINNNKKQK